MTDTPTPLSECYSIDLLEGRVRKVPLPFEHDGMQYTIPWTEAIAASVMQHTTSDRNGLQLSPTVHCARWNCLIMDRHIGEPECDASEWRMPLDIPGLLEPLTALHTLGFAHSDIKCSNYVQHAKADGRDHRMLIDYGLSQAQWGANRLFQPDSLCTASTRPPCLWHAHYASTFSLRRCDVYAAMSVPLEARVKQVIQNDVNPRNAFPSDLDQLCDHHRMNMVEDWHASELNMRMLLGHLPTQPETVKPLCKVWAECARQSSASKASELWKEAWAESGLPEYESPKLNVTSAHYASTKPIKPSIQPEYASNAPQLLHKKWQKRLRERNMRVTEPSFLQWSVIVTLAQNSPLWRTNPTKSLLAALLYVLEPNCTNINFETLFNEGLGTFNMARVDWEPLLHRSMEVLPPKDRPPYPEDPTDAHDVTIDDLLRICCH